MITKLLRRNISTWQLAAYSIACLVGLSILLVSVSFYKDLSSARSSETGDGDYIVLSKPVSLLAALGRGATDAGTFSRHEIDELRQQPWAKRVGQFTTADFNISATVEFAGRGLSTALFFESLPDEFVDIDTALWKFDSSSKEIPILVPRDYLSLYNFGFAASRGMPQLSEDLIKQIPLQISMAGNGHYDVMPARIAGLSSRLNTIAVPDTFMKLANKRYGSDNRHSGRPSRLIVEVSAPGDPAISQWLEDNNIESSSDSAVSGRTAYLATVVATVVGAIGAVIAALAVMILLLSLFLLIQKNSDKIRDLTLLGYTRRRVGAFYRRLIISINGAVTAAAIIIAAAVSQLWHNALASLGAESGSLLTVILSAVVIMGVVTAISLCACSRMIKLASR